MDYWKQYKRFRTEMINLVGKKCEVCNQKEKRLVLHHLDMMTLTKACSIPERNIRANILVLCDKCHWEKHKEQRKANRIDWRKYLMEKGLY